MVKYILYNKSILISILLSPVILSSLVLAGGNDQSGKELIMGISGYIETGKRSTADDYEEEDSDADYTYYNYQVKFRQDLSEWLGYDLSSFKYIKDYDSSDDLDNKSKIFKTNWYYYITKQKERSIKLDINIQYKEKGYYDSPEREFSQFRVSPSLKLKKEGIYAVNILTGFNKYDFITVDQKDQFKYSAKLDGYRYFQEKRLMLSGYYGIEHLNHKQTGRDRTKHNLMSGIDYIFEHLYIYKIETKVKWGKRDIKDEDERDEDSDYEYRQYNVKTFHKINDKLKTDLKYNYFIKDYNNIDLDHRGYFIVNGYDYEMLDDMKQRAWLNCNIGRKDTKYNDKPEIDYKKITADIQLNYNCKKNWKTAIGIESSFYKYDDEQNDKKRYYAKISGEKLLFKGSLKLNLDLKYRLTQYSQKLDDEQDTVKFGVSSVF